MEIKQKIVQSIKKHEDVIFVGGLLSGVGTMVTGAVMNYFWMNDLNNSAQNFIKEQIQTDGPVSTLVKRLLRDNDAVDSVFNLKDHAALAAQKTMECLNNCQTSWPQTGIIDVLKERGTDITTHITLPSEIMVFVGGVMFFGTLLSVIVESHRGK